jgi:adenylate cyclase
MDLLTAIANLVAIRLRQERLNGQLRDTEAQRARLARYHSPDVIEYMMSHKEEGLETKTHEVTVMFVDMENSTGLAERLGPARTAKLLNRFYEVTANAIFENKGSINAYIGDAVLAIFNAPLPLERHAHAAVRAALRMVKELVQESAASTEEKFNIRIGINTGIVMAGDIGHERLKRQYTVLGDPVNVASRLAKIPEVNKITIGEATYAAVQGAFECKDLGKLPIKGKELPLLLYEVIGVKEG